MIKIYFIRKIEHNGKWVSDYKIFHDRVKALRFLYATAHKYVIESWECDDPEDNKYLNYNFNRKY